MRAESVEMYCTRLSILLKDCNFAAARNLIDEAEKKERGHAAEWDMDFAELGMEPKTCYCLNCAGLFKPRDIERETYESIQEVEQISEKRAAYIMEFLRKLS